MEKQINTLKYSLLYKVVLHLQYVPNLLQFISVTHMYFSQYDNSCTYRSLLLLPILFQYAGMSKLSNLILRFCSQQISLVSYEESSLISYICGFRWQNSIMIVQLNGINPIVQRHHYILLLQINIR